MVSCSLHDLRALRATAQLGSVGVQLAESCL